MSPPPESSTLDPPLTRGPDRWGGGGCALPPDFIKYFCGDFEGGPTDYPYFPDYLYFPDYPDYPDFPDYQDSFPDFPDYPESRGGDDQNSLL